MQPNPINYEEANDEAHPWTPEAVFAQESSKGVLQWWFKFTALPEVSAHDTFLKREAVRKSRFLSSIVLFLLIIFVVFIPGCLVVPNKYIIVVDLSMIPVCAIALLLNRAQKTTLAGWLLTIAFELALTIVIFTTQPLDEPSIQQYELFVFGELLCVSLLAPPNVFLVAGINISIITASLLWQPHDPILAHSLMTQWAPIWMRPVAVQFLVAGVTYLWVSGALRAIQRADRAEMVAQFEHQVAKAREQSENERQVLQESINQIVQNHVQAMNNQEISKIPLQLYPSLLWPLINVYNSLQNRLQTSRQTEHELHQLRQAVLSKIEQSQRGFLDLDQPTGTLLDPLLSYWRNWQRHVAEQQRDQRFPPTTS